jgi:hypothetical protein
VAEVTDPGNEEDDRFGYSVAFSGNTLAVGAPDALATGVAYIFVNSGGDWKGVARLASGSSQTILFGTSVATGGDVVAVGTPDDQNGSANGVVFVFVKPVEGWRGELTPTATLTLPAVVNNLLGTSVAVSEDGTTVVAGGPGEGGSSGAYVFVEPAGGWVNMTEPTATLTSSSGVKVGNSVAMSGNTIVAGSVGLDKLGAAYVFVEPAGGWASTTQPNATLTASDESSVDGFATSVAISENTVVVGAPYHGNAGAPGAAYVFARPQTGWTNMTQTAELSVPTPPGNKLVLGYAVAVEGNVVLAGAPTDSIGKNNEQGAVFGYVEPARGWANSVSPSGSVTASPDEAMERFGASIAVSGNNFVVGAPYEGDQQGAVYIFAVH